MLSKHSNTVFTPRLFDSFHMSEKCARIEDSPVWLRKTPREYSPSTLRRKTMPKLHLHHIGNDSSLGASSPNVLLRKDKEFVHKQCKQSLSDDLSPAKGLPLFPQILSCITHLNEELGKLSN